MTIDEALAEARDRWGDKVTVAEQRYIGFSNYTLHFVHDENCDYVRASSRVSWEDAFSAAEAKAVYR